MVGRTVLHYRLISKLGAGGMGVVWRALDTRLDREVALKFLPEAAASAPARLGRFIREAKAASALNHPNIVTIYEINSEDNLHFIAMELIRGRSLSEVLTGSKRLLPAQAVNYMIQFCDGLGKAHRARIVHRDIKPSNIMLTDDGLIKILDFGLAKLLPDASSAEVNPSAPTLTKEGVAIGTVAYMSPEQAVGDAVGPCSDIFSTGVVLYEMLGGRRPFEGDSMAKVIRAVISEDPPPLLSVARDLPEELAAMTHKCLEKLPESRYADADELGAELRSFDRRSAASFPTADEQVVIARPARGLFRRRRVQAGVTLALLAVALLTGYVALRERTNFLKRSVAATSAEAFQQARAYLQRYDRKGNVDRAIDTLQPVVKQEPANAVLHAVLAEAYVRKFTETGDKAWLQQAATSGRQAVAANDDLAAAHTALGMALAANGQNEQAAVELERARDLDPLSSAAYVTLAQVRFAQGRIQESEQLHEKAVQLSPGDWWPITWLGIFYYRTARYDEAVTSWRNALALSTDNVTILRNLGPGYYATSKYEEAAATFQRALELDPTAVSTWANLGTARYFQGRYADAAAAMEKAVELAPSNYLYWGNLGDGYRWAPGLRYKAAAAYANASRLAREKLALDLNDTAVRSSLAVYMAKAGDTAAALSEVAQVERTRSNSPGAIFKTALVYELAQDRGKALAALEAAVRAGYSMAEVVNEPELAALRSDPNYRRIATLKTKQ